MDSDAITGILADIMGMSEVDVADSDLTKSLASFGLDITGMREELKKGKFMDVNQYYGRQDRKLC